MYVRLCQYVCALVWKNQQQQLKLYKRSKKSTVFHLLCDWFPNVFFFTFVHLNGEQERDFTSNTCFAFFIVSVDRITGITIATDIVGVGVDVLRVSSIYLLLCIVGR